MHLFNIALFKVVKGTLQVKKQNNKNIKKKDIGTLYITSHKVNKTI